MHVGQIGNELSWMSSQILEILICQFFNDSPSPIYFVLIYKALVLFPFKLGVFPLQISATLNIGWKPTGDEWIRRKDYLNDTSHHLEIFDKNIKQYQKDIEIKFYN